ncbi:MAG: hypothetical protein K2M86_01215, partial [Odoribacter sp.]|nr:hypothetical protein [Odoribacter sp.]
PQAVPYYLTNSQNQDLEIHYYYSDTIYPGMPESKWKEVTGYADTVSLDQAIAFRTAGYYKMMIAAENICNDVGGVKIDTLWTDFVEGSPDKHRYFRVYSSDSTKMVCKTKRLCMNDSRTIKIVDNNSRRGYEPPPEYIFQYRFLQPSPYVAYEWQDDDWEIDKQIWRNGQRIDGISGSDKWGCDSTVIYLTLKDKDFYGELEINLERKTSCASTWADFNVEVGKKPNINHNEFARILMSNSFIIDTQAGVLMHCDTVSFPIPIDWLGKDENVNGFPLDSACLFVREGSAKEERLVYRAGDVSVPTVLLDSLDVPTVIKLSSYNVCGTTSAMLDLQIAAKPKVELLRDSVSRNDSLCIGLDYPYYWKGIFPKNYTIQMTSPAEVFVNGEKREGDTEIELKNGDNIRYEAVGLVDEHFVIKNTRMLECVMDSIGKLEMLALPDTVLHRDSVGYCKGSLELKTEKLFKPGQSDFKWGVWKLNAGKEQKANLPVLTLTGEVDTLRYKLSRSKGCYVEGKLLLRPRAVPELKLKDQAQYCLPYTMVNFREESFVEKLSLWNGCNHLTAYKDEIKGSTLRYEDDITTGPTSSFKLPLDKMNGSKLIYEMKNLQVDTALMGKCRVLDTVLLKVTAPKLTVLKGDTLKFPWAKFDFARLKDGFVDTAQLVPSSLQWRLVPEGIDCGPGLYGGAYMLTDAD